MTSLSSSKDFGTNWNPVSSTSFLTFTRECGFSLINYDFTTLITKKEEPSNVENGSSNVEEFQAISLFNVFLGPLPKSSNSTSQDSLVDSVQTIFFIFDSVSYT